MFLDRIDKTNHSAYRYQEAVLEDFTRICDPLVQHFNVSTFGYMKFFLDGSYISLLNQLDWQKHYFFNVHQNGLMEWDKMSFAKNSGNTTTLIPSFWPQVPCSTLTQSLFEHNIWNGFHYLNFQSNFVEIWSIAAGANQTGAQDFYFRNRGHFLRFIDHFNVVASDLTRVEDNDTHKMGFHKNGYHWPSVTFQTEEEMKIEAFLQELSLQQVNKISTTTRYSHKNSILTQRELQCLSHLAKGETAKEIANHLCLSPRTVEAYISHVKFKTDLQTRSDLVKMYQDHVLADL